MKAFFLLLSFGLAFFSGAGTAQAYSPREMKRNHQNCVWFLKKSPAEQKRLARQIGQSAPQLVSACQFLVKQGLKRSIELENEYQDWAHGRGKFRPRRGGGGGWGGSCTSNMGCLAHQHCVGGSCESKNAVSCDNGARSCSLYQRCVNGTCQ
jgi:hypothetical protein